MIAEGTTWSGGIVEVLTAVTSLVAAVGTIVLGRRLRQAQRTAAIASELVDDQADELDELRDDPDAP